MANNAFRSGKKTEAQKGFFETHGVALGGGVLALGMMVVGSQYMQQENLTADATDEAEVVTEESVAETETPDDVVAVETEESEGDVIVEDESSTEESETGIEGEGEEVTAENSAEESEVVSESAEDEVVVADSASSSTGSNITNPVTQNTAPLYADPVEGGEEVAAVEAEATESLAPAVKLAVVPVSPAVPSGILNVELQTEGVVESQGEMNLVPVIPQ